jgi:hypothetical protein
VTARPVGDTIVDGVCEEGSGGGMAERTAGGR